MINTLERTRPLFKGDHLRPTERGWLFMGRHGGPCDKACKMCYYAYQNQLTFYKLETLIAHANLFRHHYGLGYCDISGGEATIYGPKAKDGTRPDLETLLRHCRNIGLLPTIITHGQNNTEALVKGIEDAGLEDWLISMHGLPSGHDQTVVNHSGKGEGGWQRLVNGLKHITRPVRFNTTVQDFNYKELPALAQWLADNRPATVWNMIQFNPFYAWAGKEVIEFQDRMSEIAPLIGESVRIAEAAGWEVNVRYFPFCIAADHGFEKNCINFFQTQYDPWEWCLATTNRVPMEGIQQIGGIEATRRLIADGIARSRNNAECAKCRFHAICEGPTDQYQARFGNSELKPIEGTPILDISYFEKGGSFSSGD